VAEGERDMTVDDWLRAAIADAERRGLPELKPLLDTFANALRALRRADFNDRPDGHEPRHAHD
jgi:hypothetical protein